MPTYNKDEDAHYVKRVSKWVLRIWFEKWLVCINRHFVGTLGGWGALRGCRFFGINFYIIAVIKVATLREHVLNFIAWAKYQNNLQLIILLDLCDFSKEVWPNKKQALKWRTWCPMLFSPSEQKKSASLTLVHPRLVTSYTPLLSWSRDSSASMKQDPDSDSHSPVSSVQYSAVHLSG